jgi:integrase
VATALCNARETELLAKRHSAQRQAAGIERKPGPTLGAYAARYLDWKDGRVTEQWNDACEMHLGRFINFLGPEREIEGITVSDLEAFSAYLIDEIELRNGKRGLDPGSHNKHLNTVSNLYERAQREGRVPPGFNPARLVDRLPEPQGEARWLEIHDAALLLEAARTYEPKRDDAMPYMHALIATGLLTGGRPSELLGLEVGDISFERKTVTFRPNGWRRLKTLNAPRPVPLWPQLEAILRDHVHKQALVGGLLFPSVRPQGTGQRMVTDVRKQLDAIGERIGHRPRELNLYMFRHTYCAARLQTVDRGAPVSPFTVGRELGHGGDSLVKKIYGHLGEVRHRSEVVEYDWKKVVRGDTRMTDRQARTAYWERLRAIGYRVRR